MKKKIIFAILMAGAFFCCFLLALEGRFQVWQIFGGFLIAFAIGMGGCNLRNSFIIFSLAFTLLMVGYLSFKYEWPGMIPGSVTGLLTALLLHFGWIVPNKPFSRVQYVKDKKEN